MKELLVALARALARAMAEKLVLGVGTVYFPVTRLFNLFLGAFHRQVVTSLTEDETEETAGH